MSSHFVFFSCPDYPYCLAGKELRGVIKGLIGRCADVLPDLFDHCIYTMLRELDRQTGTAALLATCRAWEALNCSLWLRECASCWLAC